MSGASIICGFLGVIVLYLHRIWNELRALRGNFSANNGDAQ